MCHVCHTAPDVCSLDGWFALGHPPMAVCHPLELGVIFATIIPIYFIKGSPPPPGTAPNFQIMIHFKKKAQNLTPTYAFILEQLKLYIIMYGLCLH